MSFLTVTYALIFYAATALLIGGLAWRITLFAKAPAPLKIPTTPAPTTQTGVVLRMFREVVFFESLFKSTKWTWLFGWMFHIGLLLVLLRHSRYFINPDWFWVPHIFWELVELVQPFGIYAGFVMVAGLAGLWSRRILVDRVRYISALSDHLMLLLIILIGLSGLTMKFIAHTDIISVKAFFIGLITFNWQAIPTDFIFLLHISLVATLMAIFPYSKLLHAPGIFFSPTRNQVDNPRERRHLSEWAKRLEQ
ncbi:MAG: respiratory nitrate reductase subunit gamma [gamma proteobacterium symbiont of Bathyaustriella thionipta]|nr:respiratory nitrate reductase subunit gamma [gamma proteobacterium symbiont of Bathyaustriella thionipta]